MSPHSQEVAVALLIVDPQNDFMGNDDGTPYQECGNTASLSVKGAVADMKRLARFIDVNTPDKVVVTRDKHPKKHVGHAAYWINENGEHPDVFSQVSVDDVASGKWMRWDGRSVQPFDTLSASGPQTIWPEHCVADTWGFEVQTDLAAALARWEERTGKKVICLDKGMDPDLEEYGCFEAADHLKGVRTIIYVAGEASSHCVKATLEHAASVLDRTTVRKFVILTDCMSPVPGFEKVAVDFLKDMVMKKGMELGISECGAPFLA